MSKMKLIESNELIYDGIRYKVKDLGTFTQNTLKGHLDNKKICITSNSHFILIDAVFCFYRNNSDALIIRSDNVSSELIEKVSESGFTIFKVDENNLVEQLNTPKGPRNPQHGRISVLTSGSTGVPKIISHTWESLYTLKKLKNNKSLNWLLTYSPGTYAWYQMLTMFMFTPQQNLVASSSYDPDKIWDSGLICGFNAVSSTPTFFRYIFLKKGYKSLSNIELEQITLGGEPVDQSILDRLASTFPKAKITHIYASTEVGAVIVVNDKREGFPIEWLAEGDEESLYPDKPQLKIIDNILWIRSPYASSDIKGKWYNTGDMVEIRNDRVVVVGRADSQIMNIGGYKIRSKVIEELLLKNEFVIWCKVYPKKSGITGEIICADVVIDRNKEVPENIEYTLTKHCLSHGLPEWAVPRLWNFLPNIPITKNFKTSL